MGKVFRIIKWTVLIVVLLSLPFYLGRYMLHMAIISGIWIIFSLSMGFILGYLGELNFGHAAFFGIGAYSSAILTSKLHISFWLSLPLSIIITVIFGLLVGYPSLRTKGHYFALVTLGFGEIVRLLLNNLEGLTGGPVGMRSISSPQPIHIPDVITISFNSKESMYYLVLVMLFITIVVTHCILKSYLGETFSAIREDPNLSQFIGINVAKYKMINFLIASGMAGLAGVLLAHYTLYISPEQFSVGTTLNVILMVIVGGTGTIVGPILGALFLIALPEVLHAMDQYRMIIYGLILMLTIIFLPSGIMGLINQLTSKVSNTFNLVIKRKKAESAILR